MCEKGSPKTEIMEFVHSEDVQTYNLLVNLDELDAIRRSQHAALKR